MSMDNVLMHWRSWGLMNLFVRRFGHLPGAPEDVSPDQVAHLLMRSVFTGEVVAPLTLPAPIIRVNEIPRMAINRQRMSDKLRKYLDDL
jgi:hypothetical protein